MKPFVRPVASAVAALVVAAGAIVVATNLWGVRGKSQSSTSSESGAVLGSSYVVNITPPWWAYPAAIALAVLAGAATWRAMRDRT